MWKRFSRLNELKHSNLKFKHGTVQKIDTASKVADWIDRSGQLQQHSYDYVIVATGLRRHWPAVPKSGSYEEFLRDSKDLVDQITGGDPNQKDRRVVIIGAGKLYFLTQRDNNTDMVQALLALSSLEKSETITPESL
jgi:NADH dehydrogenase FAD-containing subunit